MDYLMDMRQSPKTQRRGTKEKRNILGPDWLTASESNNAEDDDK
jgi:hypothetical protein